MYHSLDASGSVVSVAPADFADQMACLADMGFRGISLRDAVAHRDASGRWPDHSVVLTFDDGYASVHEHGLAILARRNFSATMFVVSGFVGGRNNWASPPAGLGIRATVTWEQVAEMAAAGVDIGAHTRTHPDLRRLCEAEVEHEMATSRAEIESHMPHRVESFAYPFGGIDAVASRVAARHFRAACTTVLQRATHEPLHLLPRVDMYYLRSLANLQRLVSGTFDHYLTLRRWGRSVRSTLRRNG
jgi:peptidoglycan/xylan/chitin deacetylase (PgdA/CDA1 family)